MPLLLSRPFFVEKTAGVLRAACQKTAYGRGTGPFLLLFQSGCAQAKFK